MAGLMPLILLVAMVAMWWFMSRSQKKQQQERQNQLSAMKPGDKVVTIGGLHGVLSEINPSTVIIDCEGIFLEFEKSAIRTVKSAEATEPVATVAEATEVIEETPETTDDTETKN
ncbi:preprotein translocase subunit YajC [Enterococcus sp. HY326]|uniref:preprotein translocase subunit YajC n=1 Tax=Enterococcus sp. HY326 TaxID=2971265 RepID=UPI00223F1CB7|nr:preprotein translocase subunit YajC [Enterococcus sp. HY326]